MDFEKNTFVLCFSAVIWKRIFICANLYSKHKNIEISPDIILKCLKYNLLSPTGFVSIAKPYLIRALTNGFLMPKEYRENKYIEKAILLFGEGYKICQIGNKDERKSQEIDFIYNYCSKNDEKNNDEKNNEEKDLLLDIGKNITETDFCNLIDVWDVELGLIDSEDLYFKILQYSLLSTLGK